MGDCYAIRKTSRKWWTQNYFELLGSVVMFYVGMTLLLMTGPFLDLNELRFPPFDHKRRTEIIDRGDRLRSRFDVFAEQTMRLMTLVMRLAMQIGMQHPQSAGREKRRKGESLENLSLDGSSSCFQHQFSHAGRRSRGIQR